MTKYSHSRLGLFEQCKQKYKFKYIDKIEVEIPEIIETFMGKKVHETLEKLYKDLQFQKLDSKEELLLFFEQTWKKDWNDKILINKKEYNASNYQEMGRKFISDYYDHYKPFNQTVTIGLETEDLLKLDNDQYDIRIDRLACDKEGNYYVCDYKTNNKLKPQEELDEDRQLAMYSLWVKKNFKDCKSVKLIWYFLAFDKEMISERSEEQLENLKDSVQNIIQEIQNCKEFTTNVTPLCDYCIYKPQCPAWKHQAEIEKKTPVEFKEDEGVKFVDELETLEKIREESENKIEEIKQKIIEFSKQKGLSAIFGTNKKALLKKYNKIEYDENIIQLIKQKGLYEEVSAVNYSKLNSRVLKGELDEEIISLIQTKISFKVSLSNKK